MIIEMFPDCLSGLMEWTKSPNRWMRGAAAVSLIVPARKGKFLKEIFLIADMLFDDRDDMVQKGYGWLLKVASKPYHKEVFDYVYVRRAAMSRTALRYAIEKMPKGLKSLAMAK
jgi:3-methyladenine DNA glycosylase AlkD